MSLLLRKLFLIGGMIQVPDGTPVLPPLDELPPPVISIMPVLQIAPEGDA